MVTLKLPLGAGSQPVARLTHGLSLGKRPFPAQDLGTWTIEAHDIVPHRFSINFISQAASPETFTNRALSSIEERPGQKPSSGPVAVPRSAAAAHCSHLLDDMVDVEAGRFCRGGTPRRSPATCRPPLEPARRSTVVPCLKRHCALVVNTRSPRYIRGVIIACLYNALPFWLNRGDADLGISPSFCYCSFNVLPSARPRPRRPASFAAPRRSRTNRASAAAGIP
jgi:hypothetical protein